MLKTKLSIFIILIFGCAAFAQQPDPDFSDKLAALERQKFMLKSMFEESGDYAETDLVYQRMEWEIDPNVKYIKGNITSYFTSQLEGLAEIEFDLNDTMRVDSVIQYKQKIKFSQNDNKLIIELTRALGLMELDSVQVFYQGEPEPEINGFGSFTKSEHAGTPTIFTLSEPYGAMEWWPCKQSLIDKIDSIDIIVTTPEKYRTASNGIVVSDTVENGFRKMHWKHRHPIAAYLVAIAVTNYAVYSDWLDLEDGRRIEILNYVYPENLDTAKVRTSVTAEFIELFNRLIGEYPFADEKYGHAQFGWGGGMEHQTMSFMFNFNYELIAHELAHQWFGDYITCGSWQDIWLNEGFATYLSGLVYENLQDGYWWPIWKKLNVERIISQPDGSVYVNDTTKVGDIFSSRLSYSKGAYILQMLRWILGDEKFFIGMKNYFNDPLLANGFALTNDFVKHMETAGDTILTEFINDWFYGEGYPIYSAEFSGVDEGVLKITLSQTSTHSSVKFFEMPVPVRVYNFDKTDSLDFRLINTTNNQAFFVEVNFNVAELKIDPDYWLVSKTAQIVDVQSDLQFNKIAVFPNPFKEKVSVQLSTNEQLISLQLYNTEGNCLKEYYGNKTNFNWPDLHKGLYILVVKTTAGTFNQKLVKQ
jgi:aminopeptidase N